jgi:hypothetical protein
MFEKIGIAAEKLATNVSESRRGFLVGLGKAALGVTGVVAGLLALPSEAQATHSGYCQVIFHGGICVWATNGVCTCPGSPCRESSTCPRNRCAQRNSVICNGHSLPVDINIRCTCP